MPRAVTSLVTAGLMLLASTEIDLALGGGIACREGDVCSCEGRAKIGIDARWTDWKQISGQYTCSLDYFGMGDPAPGAPKACKCKYSAGGMAGTEAVVQDNSNGSSGGGDKPEKPPKPSNNDNNNNDNNDNNNGKGDKPKKPKPDNNNNGDNNSDQSQGDQGNSDSGSVPEDNSPPPKVNGIRRFPSGMSWGLKAWGPKEGNLGGKDAVTVDAEIESESSIRSLKRNGQAVICYMSVGTQENWRPSYWMYPSRLETGNYGHEFREENWLDLNRWRELVPTIRMRLRIARDKGCDGVELDNTDCYQVPDKCSDSGKSYDQLKSIQVQYIRWLLKEAHRYGLAAGLKNVPDISARMAGLADFAIYEQCEEYNECHYYQAYENRNKAVFGVEYTGSRSDLCDAARSVDAYLKYRSGSSWRNCS